MQFNLSATTKDGIIQGIEFWTKMPDGTITGTLLKQFTGRINAAFDMVMPRLLSYSDQVRWDDINHTDLPIGTVNIESGQSDYKITEDDNSLDILNITNVRILESASGTEYKTLDRLHPDDERALDAMSPNPSVSGTPTHFLERGNIIFLYPKPNYAATNGIKLFFEREQFYFVSTDTTREPGIPKPFHELLVLYPALDWNVIYRSKDVQLITELRARVLKKETALDDMISLRNPTRARMETSYTPKGNNYQSGRISLATSDSNR